MLVQFDRKTAHEELFGYMRTLSLLKVGYQHPRQLTLDFAALEEALSQPVD